MYMMISYSHSQLVPVPESCDAFFLVGTPVHFCLFSNLLPQEVRLPKIMFQGNYIVKSYTVSFNFGKSITKALLSQQVSLHAYLQTQVL